MSSDDLENKNDDLENKIPWEWVRLRRQCILTVSTEEKELGGPSG